MAQARSRDLTWGASGRVSPVSSWGIHGTHTSSGSGLPYDSSVLQ
jgi:hypothetical protein